MSRATNLLKADLLTRPGDARRLSHPERCGVYYAVFVGKYRQSVIAEAFGITRPTVNYIARGAGGKYAKIADEFQTLGAEAFGEKYFTEAMFDALAAANGAAYAARHDPVRHGSSFEGFHLLNGFDGPALWQVRRESDRWEIQQINIPASSAANLVFYENRKGEYLLPKPPRTSRAALIELYRSVYSKRIPFAFPKTLTHAEALAFCQGEIIQK